MKINYIKGILGTLLFLLAVSLVKAETITFYHVDLLGSPVAESNMNGEIQWSQDYRPYGERTVSSAETDVNEMWYTGKQHDDDSGLTYMQNRYYDPSIGRFMAMDPLPFRESDVSSFGTYTYVGNNPYRYIDPDGQDRYDINQAKRNNGHKVVDGPQMTEGQARLLASFMIPGMGLYEAHEDFQKGNYVWATVGVLSEVPFLKWLKGSKGAKATKGACCFVAGTQVLTESGYKNIEEVKLGEKLWAKNVETGEEDWKPVTRVFVEKDRGIFDIRLKAIDGVEQKIEATDDHPFYVVGIGWKKTIELQVGDKLESNLGNSLEVISVRNENRNDVTYNFTIADFHTYYVTKRNVLVHNCPIGDDIGEIFSNWKPKKSPWNKGKRTIHVDDHGGDFGTSDWRVYTEKAISFMQKPNNGQFLDHIQNSFIYRYDPKTKTIFIGTKKGVIKTFYKWDGRPDDAVINMLKEAGKLPW